MLDKLDGVSHQPALLGVGFLYVSVGLVSRAPCAGSCFSINTTSHPLQLEILQKPRFAGCLCSQGEDPLFMELSSTVRTFRLFMTSLYYETRLRKSPKTHVYLCSVLRVY